MKKEYEKPEVELIKFDFEEEIPDAPDERDFIGLLDVGVE